MRKNHDLQTDHQRASYRRTGVLWVVGGLLWLVTGALGSGLHGWRFNLAEALWIGADLLLLGGLIGLRRLRAHGQSRPGNVGMTVAIVGRVAFIAAELISLAQRSDENALLPIAALLSAAGMLCYGVAVVRAGVWHGPSRFGPLAMGLYPFLVMFPSVAANNGNPSLPAIAVWGLVGAVGVGFGTLAAGGNSDASPSTFSPSSPLAT